MTNALIHIKIIIRAGVGEQRGVRLRETDDQGYGDVGFHQIHAPVVSTPRIDQIAENELIFTSSYVAA